MEGIEVEYRNGVINIEINHLLVLIQGYETFITLNIINIVYYKLILELL